MIAALPDTVMEDNADNVRAQLDHILALYGELSWEEQEQIDLSTFTSPWATYQPPDSSVPAISAVRTVQSSGLCRVVPSAST
mgnify:CR=1 FL=1